MNLNNIQINTSPKYNLILDTVRKFEPLGRCDIAKITGLSGAAVTKLVRDLIQKGFLKEDGFGASKGGRYPVLLKLVPEAMFVIGVDIGAAKIRSVVVDLEANIVAGATHSTHPEEGKEKTLKKIMDIINEVVEQSGVNWDKIKGIGIGLSGIIDHKSGVCLFWPDVEGWENVPLKEIVEDKFGLPVQIDDSARTMALAESWCGLAKEVENFIFINLGIGVGAAIFFHSQLYRGTGGTAGELGHMTIDENGPRCSCGNYGCLETLVSGPAIARRARKALKDGVISIMSKLAGGKLENVTSEIVVEAAKRGDKLAFNLMEKTGEYLGIGIANAINIFNPQLVIIGAGVSKAGDLILDPLKRTVKKRALQVASSAVEIKISKLGDRSGALGAATLILKDIFQKHKKLKV